jgi:hypothetical protein
LKFAPDSVEIRANLDSVVRQEESADRETASHITRLRQTIEDTAAANDISALRRSFEAKVTPTTESDPTTDHPCTRSVSLQHRSGVVSPAMFVTQAQCVSAFREIVRLQKRQDNLTAKIAEVQRWELGLNKDEKEFENLRLGAQQDLGWEFVDHVPIAEGLDALKGNAALQGVNIERIKTSYEAIKGALETGRGISANDAHERAKQIIFGNRELTEAMIHATGLDENSKALLDTVSKIMNVGADVAIATSTENISDREKLKTVMTIVEIIQPWWGFGTLGENVAERGVQYHEANEALVSLHDAQSKNWNARRFLTQKLNQVNEEVTQQQLIITKYQMASD